MKTQFAVLHTAKGEGTGGGLGYHIDRDQEHNHTFEHVNKELSYLNQDLTAEKWKSMNLSAAVNQRIQEGYNGKRKIRNDAVSFLATILSGSHDQMKEIESDPGVFNLWVQKNKEWAEKEFGKENIVRFTVHLDEKTPHIHCVHVPLTADGRLSAKELLGGSKLLRARQDDYAEAMKSFGLERGVKTTENKHITTKDFYKDVNKIEKYIENNATNELLEQTGSMTKADIENVLRSSLMALERAKKSKKKDKSYQFFIENKLKQADKNIEKLKDLEQLYDVIVDQSKEGEMLKVIEHLRREHKEEMLLLKIKKEQKTEENKKKGGFRLR